MEIDNCNYYAFRFHRGVYTCVCVKRNRGMKYPNVATYAQTGEGIPYFASFENDTLSVLLLSHEEFFSDEFLTKSIPIRVKIN
jgi:hypothetical protein